MRGPTDYEMRPGDRDRRSGFSADSMPGASPLRRELVALFRKRWLIAQCIAASLALASLYNYGARPLYEATSVVALEVAGSSVLQLNTSVDQSLRAAAIWEQVEGLKSRDLALLVLSTPAPALSAELSRGLLGGTSDRLLGEVRYRLGLGPSQSALVDHVDALRSRLSVVNEPNSGWVRVSLRAYDPVAATDALNRLIDVYVREAANQARMMADERRARLEREVTDRAGRASENIDARQGDEAWAALQEAETTRRFLEKQIAGLQDALVQSQRATLAQGVLHRDAQRLQGRALLTIPSLRADPAAARITAHLSDLEGQLARKLAGLGVRHPDVLALKEEIAASDRELRARLVILKQAIERDYRVAQREEATLTGRLRQLERELAQLGPETMAFALAERQSAASQQAVGDLIERSVREPDEIVFLSPRIVQAAEGPAPLASPMRSRNLLYSLAIGLGLGLAIVWLLGNIDETLSIPEQIQELLSVPCLGIVPHVEGAQGRLLRLTEVLPSQTTEPYRVIRTNFTASHQDDRSVFLLVTSTSPGEGKTTTSLGLVLALAATGDRVLLVDGDVRRGTLSRLIGFNNRNGLLDLATGAASSSCIFATRFVGLDCMPSGNTDPRAIEALSHPSFRDTLLAATRDYRWVVCDAPPVLAVADAAILCRVADEVVMVVRAGETPAGAVRAAISQVTAAGGRLRGAVLNAVDLRGDSYYYRYYGSGYYGVNAAKSAKGRPEESV